MQLLQGPPRGCGDIGPTGGPYYPGIIYPQRVSSNHLGNPHRRAIVLQHRPCRGPISEWREVSMANEPHPQDYGRRQVCKGHRPPYVPKQMAAPIPRWDQHDGWVCVGERQWRRVWGGSSRKGNKWRYGTRGADICRGRWWPATTTTTGHHPRIITMMADYVAAKGMRI
jgi:hypothetical protein